MRASYFGDYENYAVDSKGEKFPMEDRIIWYREAKVYADYCAIGKDFIAADRFFYPVIEIKFSPGSHKIKFLAHHIYSEFVGSTRFFFSDENQIIIDSEVNQGEIHEYEILLERTQAFSLKFMIQNDNISHGILRYLIEDEMLKASADRDSFSFQKEVSFWKPNVAKSLQREVNHVHYATEYKY